MQERGLLGLFCKTMGRGNSPFYSLKVFILSLNEGRSCSDVVYSYPNIF